MGIEQRVFYLNFSIFSSLSIYKYPPPQNWGDLSKIGGLPLPRINPDGIQILQSSCFFTNIYLQILSPPSSLLTFLAHLSRRLMAELIVYQSLRRPSGVRPSTISNIFSSKTTGQIELKFHMETL